MSTLSPSRLFELNRYLADSVDQDQTAQNVQSDPDLHSLRCASELRYKILCISNEIAFLLLKNGTNLFSRWLKSRSVLINLLRFTFHLQTFRIKSGGIDLQ